MLGAGVSGLTSALCLKERGFDPTVVAEKFAPSVTSVVAGALWESPPAVCGFQTDHAALKRAREWSRISYRRFASLGRDSQTGVFMRTVNFYFRRPVAENPRQLSKMNDLRQHVDGFIHDRSLAAANSVNPEFGINDAYAHQAPMIDTDAYMSWLLERVRQAGCRIICRKISGSLRGQESSLRREFSAEAIVNCAGLGARELAGDEVYPVRGALVRIRNDGRAMPRITEAHCVSRDDASDEPGFVFIVPRGHDMLVLGGLAEPDEWEMNIGLDNYAPLRRVYERCVDFLPVLKRGQIDGAEPARVGLRPFRRDYVRLEREPGTRIVHNYGHGGSGVTLSWGCASEVAETVGRMLSCSE